MNAGRVQDRDISMEGRCVVIVRIVALNYLSDQVNLILAQVHKELLYGLQVLLHLLRGDPRLSKLDIIRRAVLGLRQVLPKDVMLVLGHPLDQLCHLGKRRNAVVYRIRV